MADKHGTGLLAWFIVAGFFATVAGAMWRGIPSGESHDIVLMLVTAVVTYTGTVVNFHYGSTTGSEKKSEQISQLAQTAAVTASTAAAVQAATTAPPIVPDVVKVDVTGAVDTSPKENEP
jgi:hypothetical protein